MKNRGMVSIIVPVYNTEEYLRRCVDSLISQTWKNLEIILIDDGSEDRSGEICDEYADKFPQINVIHQKNRGVSAARNQGIEIAKGDYLAFVDSDDWVSSKLIESYFEMMDIEAGIVPVCVAESGGKGGIQKYSRRNFMEFLSDEHVNVPWNKLYEAGIVHANHLRFDENKSLGEDFAFNMEYLRYAPEEYWVNTDPLYYHQEGREGSLENSYHPELFKLQIETFQVLRHFLQETGNWNMENQRIWSWLFFSRLYLTIQIYRKYERQEKYKDIECTIAEALRDPVWKQIVKECRIKKVMDWKCDIKYLHIRLLRLKYKGI